MKGILKNKKVLIAIGVILLAVGAWYLWKKKKSKLQAIVQGGLKTDSILQNGSTGPEVSELQSMMLADGANLGNTGPNADGVDGVFGPLTESELIRLKGVDNVTLEEYPHIPLKESPSVSIPNTGSTKAG